MINGHLQDFYPDFVPNQVLTSTQLNDLRTYLEQQTRLSRIRLSGSGIVCGLTWSVDERADGATMVTLRGGYGVTSQGYLLEGQDQLFTRYYEYSDPRQDEDHHPLYEPWHTAPDNHAQIELLALLGDEAAEEEGIDTDIRPLTADVLAGKVLVLYLEAEDAELKSCLVTDCDNKGVKVQLAVRALLVSTADLEAMSLCEPPDPPAPVPRLHAALEDRALENIDDADQINGAYARIVRDVWPDLAEQIEEAYDTYGTLLAMDEEEMAALEAAGAQIEEAPDTALNQYHYGFVKDLAAAYEEFLVAACRLIWPCFPASTFPRHLMLGALDGDAGYRNLFSPSPVRNVMDEDLENTRKLFRRLLTLARTFNVEVEDDIRITPSQTEPSGLGDRAVPYYYGQGEEGLTDDLKKLWQPARCCTTAPLLSYHQQNGAAFDAGYAGYSFFRIEGHLEHSCDEAAAELEELRRMHNLEFDVRTAFLERSSSEEELLQEMNERLKEIDDTWRASPFWIRSITDLLHDSGEIDWKENSPLHVRARVTELKKELFARHEEWKELRKPGCCDTSGLEAAYLSARSDFLGVYEPVFSYLDAVLDVLMQLPALITEKLPEMVGEADWAAARDRMRSRLDELDAEISTVESHISGAAEASERASLRANLSSLRETRANISSLSETIRRTTALSDSIRSVFVPAEAEEPTAGEEEQGVPAFVLTVLFGVIQELMRLRDTVHELTHYLLPRDLHLFNYALFRREYAAVVRTALEARLLPVFLFLYVAALDRRDDLPVPPLGELEDFLEEAGDGSLGQGLLDMFGGSEKELAAFSPFTARLITIVLQVVGSLPITMKLLTHHHHNRALGGLATAFHSLEHVRQHACETFNGLARRHPGLEHLAGVEKGGTFVLVCGGNDDREVVADFALRGTIDCCCASDLGGVCRPPVAAPDFAIAVRQRRGEEGTSGAASVDIRVLRNDFSLNEDGVDTYATSYNRHLRVELSDEATEQDGKATLATGEDGAEKPGWVTYVNEREDFYGLDHFTYTLIDERCDETTTGQVLVLVLPAFPLEAPPRETATVMGTVRDKETNAGIPGAEVAIRETDYRATTHDKGDFLIEGVPVESYTMIASHPDYASSTHAIDLTAGETEVVDIGLTSEEEPVETGNLVVEVLDDKTGEAITDYDHSVENVETGESPSAVLIGGNRFVYNGLEAGSYRLTVSKLGYGTFVQLVDIAAGTTRNVTARLKPIIIEVADEGQLAFRIVEVGMQELPAAEVTLLINGPGADQMKCVTDGEGTCSTDKLPAGEYLVSLADRSLSRTLSVMGGQTTEVLFRLIDRTSFALGRETPVIGWAAETNGLSVEEAQAMLAKVYKARYQRFVAGTEQVSGRVQADDAYLQAARFLGGVIPHGEVPMDELNTRYEKTRAALQSALAAGEDTASYRGVLQMNTSAYLDRWTTLSPAEVSGDAESMFSEIFATLTESGVDLAAFAKRWNGADLVERFNLGSARRLLELLNAEG